MSAHTFRSVLVAGALAVATMSPTSSTQCSAGALCLWSGANYTGTFYSTSATSAEVTGLTLAGSVWNRMPVAVRVYSGAGGSGTWTCVAAGKQTLSTTLTARSLRALTTSGC